MGAECAGRFADACEELQAPTNVENTARTASNAVLLASLERTRLPANLPPFASSDYAGQVLGVSIRVTAGNEGDRHPVLPRGEEPDDAHDGNAPRNR